MQKHCSKCKEITALAPANLKKGGVQGFRSWCLACEKKRKDAWRLQNKEHHNAKCRNWVEANLEKRKLIVKKWNQENIEAVREAKRLWRYANPDRARAQVNARRSAMRRATLPLLNEFDRLYIDELYHLAQLRKVTVDHIVPLQHKDVCGLHVPWNLRLMDASKNFSKSNMFNGVATRECTVINESMK